MDMAQYCKMQVERAHEHLAKHIDYMIDELEDEHRHLTMSEIREMRDALQAMHAAHELLAR